MAKGSLIEARKAKAMQDMASEMSVVNTKLDLIMEVLGISQEETTTAPVEEIEQTQEASEPESTEETEETTPVEPEDKDKVE
jgi:hypothetical protein